MGEVTTRITFNVFIKGELSQFVAEHNRRSLCTFLEVDGKIEKSWEGLTIDKFAEQPYTFYVKEQKFVLLWNKQPEDVEADETFNLKQTESP